MYSACDKPAISYIGVTPRLSISDHPLMNDALHRLLFIRVVFFVEIIHLCLSFALLVCLCLSLVVVDDDSDDREEKVARQLRCSCRVTNA